MRALLLFIMMCPCLYGESLSFSELNREWNEKEICIRGFLYKTDDEQLILAGEPNLKHCCVGSEKKRGCQIYINNPSLSPQLTVMELAGKLVIKDGRYTLENARQLESSPKHPVGMLLGASALLLGGLVLFKRRGISNRDNGH